MHPSEPKNNSAEGSGTHSGAGSEQYQPRKATGTLPPNGESPLETTRKHFREGGRLKVTVSGDTVTISGAIYSLPRYSAELVVKYVKDQVEGIYEVDGRTIRVQVNLTFALVADVAEIIVIPHRGEKPLEGFRDNSEMYSGRINNYANDPDAPKILPHEFMHLLGFDDMYIDTDRGSVAFAGHENDIMGDIKGVVQPYHIQVLLEHFDRERR
jgi:hypothetical protein